MVSDSNEKNKRVVDEICEEVLRIINAVKHPDVSSLMDESRESLFEHINEKIETEFRINNHRFVATSLSRFLVVACFFILVLFSTAFVAYYIGNHSEKEALSQVRAEFFTPLGTTSTLTLTDGTIVTLNGGSKLTYPVLFDKVRQVSLMGEGFFDVAKDSERPFIVNSGTLSVKVLGTRFGFKSYQEDCQTIITLEEGMVKATPLNKKQQIDIVLEPSQQLILDNHTGEFQCRNVNTREFTSWKEGILYFRNSTLGEIAKTLERRFNIKIIIHADEIRNQRYFAHFESGENVDQILTLLSYKRSWKYLKRNGTIEITR